MAARKPAKALQPTLSDLMVDMRMRGTPNQFLSQMDKFIGCHPIRELIDSCGRIRRRQANAVNRQPAKLRGRVKQGTSQGSIPTYMTESSSQLQRSSSSFCNILN